MHSSTGLGGSALISELVQMELKFKVVILGSLRAGFGKAKQGGLQRLAIGDPERLPPWEKEKTEVR